MNNENKKYYDWIHLNFPNRWESPVHKKGYQDIDLWVKYYLDKKYNDNYVKILDLGCGTGRTLECINHPNRILSGIDYSETAIILAQKRLGHICQLTVGDIDKINYSNDYFDIVLSIGTHEHVDPINFEEPYRILKSEGIFIAYFCFNYPKESTGKVWQETYYAVDLLDKHFEWNLSQQEWHSHLSKSFNKIEFEQGFFICKK